MHCSLLVFVALVACGGSTTTRSVTPVQRGGAPCFPDRDAIEADEVLGALAPYLHGDGNAPVPFGTCTFTGGMLGTTDGTDVVEEDACELGVRVPKIRDHVGVEVGMRGRDVLARHGGGNLICENRDSLETLCVFSVDGVRESTQYVVAVPLKADGVVGDEAIAFFASQEIARIVIRTCDG